MYLTTATNFGGSMSDISWHTKSGEEVLSELDTPLGGLTSEKPKIDLRNMARIN